MNCTFRMSNLQLAYATTLQASGAEHGLKGFGLYAVESMRLEKGYRHWKADLITEFNPMESRLERFRRHGQGICRQGRAAKDDRCRTTAEVCLCEP